MSKKHETTHIELRATADKAVTRWRELAEIVKTKESELAAFRKANPLPDKTYGAGGVVQIPSDTLIEHLSREASLHDARANAAEAEREACLALDRAEVEEGIQDAILRDLSVLRTDLEKCYEECDAARAALDAACRQLEERAQATVAAVIAASARRQKAGLPFNHGGFNPRPVVAGAVHRQYLAEVDAAAQRGFHVPGYRKAAENIRVSIRQVAALLEHRRREKAEAEREERILRENRQAEAKESDRRMRAQAEAQQRADAEERARREKLADDYLTRRSGAAT